MTNTTTASTLPPTAAAVPPVEASTAANDDGDLAPQHSCRLSVTNDPKHIPVILAFVTATAEQWGLDERERTHIELAVEEAVSNVIRHAFAADEVATFEVSCRRAAGGIEIRVRDQGMPYDPTIVPEYQPGVPLDDQTGVGLGGFLIKQFVDEYEFRNLGPDGKELRLVKLPESPSVADEPAPSGPAAGDAAEAPKPNRQSTGVEVRWMRPAEAIEVARCVYDAYGYSYGHENIYYPDRVAALNQSGELRSAVAVTDDGSIAGHCALVFADDMPAEIGMAATKSEFRGLGVAGRLGEFLDEAARANDLTGLQVKQVSVHPYTQKFCQKLGFRDCGFLLGHVPNTMSFKGIADHLAQRGSDVLGFKFLKRPTPRTVYVPQNHAEAVKALYDHLEIPVTFARSPGRRFPDGRTSMSVAVHSRRGVGQVRINRYGSDVPRVFRQELFLLRHNDIRVVELFLNLSDPFTPQFVELAEELGFFFTGILPETGRGDCLLMQYFNGVQIDYDTLHVVSDAAKELLSYIQSGDPNCL